MLSRWRKTQLEERRAWGADWNGTALVFPHENRSSRSKERVVRTTAQSFETLNDPGDCTHTRHMER